MSTYPGGSDESPIQRGQSKKSESLSDLEERPELISQKSLDGDDSASDKGSVMEETNSHLYQDLLDAVLKMKDNNGRMICELFLKLPPRQVSTIFNITALSSQQKAANKSTLVALERVKC